jgi:hypothetical protein
MLEEFCARLNIGALNTVAVVLDASQSARGCWEDALRIAGHLFENLPADTGKGLYFLSNAREYDFARLARNATRWQKENSSRGSFITPVLEQLSKDIGQVIIIGSGYIYDLEDWQESEFASRFLFVNLGESLRNDLEIGEEMDHPAPPELVSRLYNPVLSVTISGAGFMPYYWSNPGYKLLIDDEVTLIGQNLADFSLSLSFFARNAGARIRRAEGEEQIPLEHSEIEIEDEWEPLNEKEREIFQAAIGGRNFLCPACGKELSAATLRCYEGSSILGKPVYPSFGNRRGFVTFKRTSDNIFFKFHNVEVIRLDKTRVARATGTRAKIYEYETARGTWVGKDELEPYHAFGAQYLAVI